MATYREYRGHVVSIGATTAEDLTRAAGFFAHEVSGLTLDPNGGVGGHAFTLQVMPVPTDDEHTFITGALERAGAHTVRFRDKDRG